MAGEVGARGPDLGSYVSNLANAVYKGITRVMAPHDLSPVDVQLMMICRDRGEATASQLAQLSAGGCVPGEPAGDGPGREGVAAEASVEKRDRRVVMLKLTPVGAGGDWEGDGGVGCVLRQADGGVVGETVPGVCDGVYEGGCELRGYGRVRRGGGGESRARRKSRS